MKVRHQKRKCRTNEERYFHILNKQRIRKKTDILHADFNRPIVAFYYIGNTQHACRPWCISDDKKDLVEEGYAGGRYYQDDIPIKSIFGWEYDDRYNPYDF